MEFSKQATSIFSKHLKEWESDPLRIESGYHYELTYATMMKKVEKEIFQLSVGKTPKSKNAKKTPDAIRKDIALQELCSYAFRV